VRDNNRIPKNFVFSKKLKNICLKALARGNYENFTYL